MELRAERPDTPEVAAKFSGEPYRDPAPETVRARVLEGTDKANQECGTSLHPWRVRYLVEDHSDECRLLRDGAFSIVKRLALSGENGYAGIVTFR